MHTEEGKATLLAAGVAVCLALLSLFAFSACSSDDDHAQTSKGPTVEVCIVFYPNELGDQGYADRVLTGMHQFDMQLSEDDYDRVQLRYIAVCDTDEVLNELRRWNQEGTSPYTRRAYNRRLLVLTDISLLPYLAETPLGRSDEVLVMNVADCYFDQMAEADQMGDRLHLLSISAADAARKLCRQIDYETSHPEGAYGYREPAIWLFQGHDQDEVLADSVAVVLQNHFSEAPRITIFDGSMLDPSETGYMAAYSLGNVVNIAPPFLCSYAICNWGQNNAGFYAFFHIWGPGKAEAVFLDTEIANSSHFFPTIVRHYDRALCQWLQRWLKLPAATMPRKEWHGAWDGYVTDNIKTYDE
jgi:hypothetical protein